MSHPSHLFLPYTILCGVNMFSVVEQKELHHYSMCAYDTVSPFWKCPFRETAAGRWIQFHVWHVAYSVESLYVIHTLYILYIYLMVIMSQ